MEHFKNCNCSSQLHNVNQTLTEMDFERGIWNSVIYNDVERVRQFIYDGHANDRDNFGYTALHYAARNGNLEICKMLIKLGNANVNAQTKSGATPLHRAAMMGHLEIVQFLVESEADITLQDVDGQTALHRCAEKGNIIISKYLLDQFQFLKCISDHKNRFPYDLVVLNLNQDDNNQELAKLLNIEQDKVSNNEYFCEL